MDYASSIRKALDHIERHLHEDLTIEAVAAVTGFSLSHFHSIFHRVTGCTPAEHMRRRRLSCAAIDLALSRRRVLDIALDYQFQSQEVFTRAFKQYFGVTPGLFRRHRVALPATPRIGLHHPPRPRQGEKSSAPPLSGPGDTHRLVLEGVPRVGFYQGGDQCPEQIPFPSCLAACLRYLGEAFPWLPLYGPDQEWRVNYGNVFLLGATGMAFGLLWRPGWHMDNAELLMMADPRQLIDRAFRCVGYSYRVIEKAGQPEDELRYRREIRESISTGRPVLAFGLISPTECGIITGFDEETDVLLGWDYYQDDPRFAGGHQIDPSGYFSKRDWFRQVRSLIVIGERENEPASAVDYLLSGALERVRTPAVYGRCSGLAAYSAWADHVADDAHFAGCDPVELNQRFTVHQIASLNLAELRAWAAIFVEQLGLQAPAMRDSLLAAADCYRTEHDLMYELWACTGEQEPHLRFAQAAVRRKAVTIIRRARELDEEAAVHLEHALAQHGKRS
ncbi:MAG TPA: helix-turn-helix domain-containing protein [Symbiobacteriaceae bacterium]|jgi:AraC-like DNA-binding protein|nr:helix-turn-helix domain-containing protein [Symbiobacteriaceae bacterium]